MTMGVLNVEIPLWDRACTRVLPAPLTKVMTTNISPVSVAAADPVVK
jgi:hypothetical protein